MLSRSPMTPRNTTEPRACTGPGCVKTFIPFRPMQSVCGPVCARRKVEAAKKQERAQDREKLEAMKSIPKLIAEAQFHFNEYTRLRDFDKGCYVCLRPFDQSIKGRAIHAGHVRSRGAAGHLRFTEDNCMGECEGCNAPHGAKPHQKEAGAIARIGQERFDALKQNNTPHKWTHDELRAIRDQYKAKAKELKAKQ